MPTDFNNLAYFGITNVQMNRKCWNRGVTFSSRTIYHFEQCDMLLVIFKSMSEIQCDISTIILPETLFTSFTTQLFYMFFLATVNFVIDR